MMLGRSLQLSQWLGFATVLVAVTTLSLYEHRSHAVAVAAPNHVEDVPLTMQ